MLDESDEESMGLPAANPVPDPPTRPQPSSYTGLDGTAQVAENDDCSSTDGEDGGAAAVGINGNADDSTTAANDDDGTNDALFFSGMFSQSVLESQSVLQGLDEGSGGGPTHGTESITSSQQWSQQQEQLPDGTTPPAQSAASAISALKEGSVADFARLCLRKLPRALQARFFQGSDDGDKTRPVRQTPT